MITFDEDKQNKKFEQLREQEEEDLMHMLSNKYSIPYIDLTSSPINPDALIIIPEKSAREGMIAAFGLTGKALSVAVHAPENPATKTVLAELESRGFTPTLSLTSTHSLAFVWDRYKDLSYTAGSKKGMLDIGSEDMTALVAQVRHLEDIKKLFVEALAMQKTHRISRIIEVLLSSALATKASDIHIEPEEKDVRVRMRVDGVLADVATIDSETYHLVLSRFKLLSTLKLNVQNEAQDGRFSINFKDISIEIRTSILPGQYGESIVMRILNPDSISVSIERLGMRDDLFAIITAAIAKPNGLILTTGPTGSGKTTTLYAFLKKVHTPDIKIITIEDPIEYHLKGVVQTQVDSGHDYTFQSGLRAALRQDPDIIMVGEIRDNETAEIAIHAALTGHLVFSTLHTNSAAGAFTRLIDIGINPRILGSALTLALAQRLVRILCEKCKKEVPLEGVEKEKIDAVLGTVVDTSKIASLQRERVWHAGEGGCEACNGLGYKGRMGLYEGIIVNAAIEDIIESSPSEREIRKAADLQGLLTLAQDGVMKVLEGKTTLEEIERVVDLTTEEKAAPPTPEI
ncbi:MAG: GspE/PulE family protein [Candidatus Campbellbacteria bacterium]|nr:GspE/PulE family protein [Candidatus Campbellbacteria bacterium]